MTSVEQLQRLESPVLSRLAALHATQCGFCSPGFAVALHGHLSRHSAVPLSLLSHNVCRCTGLRPIADAALSLSSSAASSSSPDRIPELRPSLPGLTCRSWRALPALATPAALPPPSPPAPSAQLPVELLDGPDAYCEPSSLQDALAALAKHKGATLSYCPQLDFGKARRLADDPLKIVSLARVSALNFVDADVKGQLRFGSMTPLVEVIKACRTKRDGFEIIGDFIEHFATPNIRATAGLGHLFRSNTNMSPLLRSIGPKITQAEGGVVTEVTFYAPKPNSRVFGLLFGPTLDRTLSLSLIVTRADNNQVRFERVECCVDRHQVSYTERFMDPKTFRFKTFDRTEEAVRQALNLIDWGQLNAADKQDAQFYRNLFASLFRRALLEEESNSARSVFIGGFSEDEDASIEGVQEFSAGETGDLFLPSGQRDERAACDSEALRSPVGDPVAHATGAKQTSGIAQYADDIIPPANVMYAAHVVSKVARGKFLKVDPAAALQMEGVIGYVDSRDLAPLDPRFKQVNDDTEKVTNCHKKTGCCVHFIIASVSFQGFCNWFRSVCW